MGSVEINVDASDLDNVTIPCPFQKRDPSDPYGYGYSYHQHDHYNMPKEHWPCEGSWKGAPIVDVVKWLVTMVNNLDAKVNPREPEPEPKPKTTRKKKVNA